ncbi:MAG: hypothetical protein OXC95_07040, partial [Dehalococcoidia bacterium]|nr:hypothetical protein [Dehalococcoidia bacterium]
MADRDIILVGGGESSKIIISSVMDRLRHRVRGVLFIDHDKDTIREMYDDMSKYSMEGVEVRDVRLHKRTLDREKFDAIAEDLGLLGQGVTWEDPLPNHPPMVRVQTRLWGQEILDALWDMLPTVGADDAHTGTLDGPRVMIVSVFGITGMTSSTVGVEAAVVLRDRLRSRLLNDRGENADGVINSTLDTGAMPMFVGVGCFPPDPTDGAGQYNIPHGLRMSRVIKENLAPSPSPREMRMRGKPFNKFLLLDGSGAWRTQDNPNDYSEWVARTLSALLTCQSVDADVDVDGTFYDSIELLDSCEPFSHVGLVMAGLRRSDKKLIEAFRFVKESVPSIYPDHAEYPNDSLLREVIGGLAGTSAEEAVQDVRDAANEWQDTKLRMGSKWWNSWMPGRKRAMEGARRRLRNALSALPERVDEHIEELNDEWEAWSHQKMWAMPLPASRWIDDPIEDSLPLRVLHNDNNTPNDHNIMQDRNEARQSTHDMVRMLMRHLIDPITTSPMKVGRGTMMLVASTRVKRDYPLPEPEDMSVSFGGRWNILMSESGWLQDHPMHLLLWWYPEDGEIMPMYYRANDELREL